MKRMTPWLLMFMISLAACSGGVATPTDEPAPHPGQTDTNPVVDNALPPDPQEVSFQASDGQLLTGYYYPSAVNPAPIVVFMHWVGGNQSDWYEVAAWLQNRDLENPFPNPGVEHWWDPTWFPIIPDKTSYGVFIFSFRDCNPYDAGCEGWTPDLWFLDAQAAMLKASTLEGVDPTKIVSIGSSIGADGAPNACAWLNEQIPGSCLGALSLSPGSYMGKPYPQVVADLGTAEPPAAPWCVADQDEIGICEAAETANNPSFRFFMIQDGGHGNFMLRPELDPLPMQIILDFLDETVGP